MRELNVAWRVAQHCHGHPLQTDFVRHHLRMPWAIYCRRWSGWQPTHRNHSGKIGPWIDLHRIAIAVEKIYDAGNLAGRRILVVILDPQHRLVEIRRGCQRNEGPGKHSGRGIGYMQHGAERRFRLRLGNARRTADGEGSQAHDTRDVEQANKAFGFRREPSIATQIPLRQFDDGLGIIMRWFAALASR